MKLRFLGTGTSQGVPVIGSSHPVCRSTDPRDQRLRSSVGITSPLGASVVIDCGPDFRAQALAAGLCRLDALVLTHEHNDHIIGLDDTRPLIFSQNRDLPIYAQERVLQEVQTRFAYAFAAHPYPGIPRFVLHPVDTAPFQVADLVIQPIPVQHYHLPILGYRIGNLAYLTDVSHLPPQAYTLLQGIDTLILSCLRIQDPHPAHLILPQALEIIRQLAPQRAYLTHMSHHMGFHAELAAALPPGIDPAYDGLEIEFN